MKHLDGEEIEVTISIKVQRAESSISVHYGVPTRRTSSHCNLFQCCSKRVQHGMTNGIFTPQVLLLLKQDSVCNQELPIL